MVEKAGTLSKSIFSVIIIFFCIYAKMFWGAVSSSNFKVLHSSNFSTKGLEEEDGDFFKICLESTVKACDIADFDFDTFRENEHFSAIHAFLQDLRNIPELSMITKSSGLDKDIAEVFAS